MTRCRRTWRGRPSQPRMQVLRVCMCMCMHAGRAWCSATACTRSMRSACMVVWQCGLRPAACCCQPPMACAASAAAAAAEEELLELKEEFALRLGAANTTIQALKVRRPAGLLALQGFRGWRSGSGQAACAFYGCGLCCDRAGPFAVKLFGTTDSMPGQSSPSLHVQLLCWRRPRPPHCPSAQPSAAPVQAFRAPRARAMHAQGSGCEHSRMLMPHPPLLSVWL